MNWDTWTLSWFLCIKMKRFQGLNPHEMADQVSIIGLTGVQFTFEIWHFYISIIAR